MKRFLVLLWRIIRLPFLIVYIVWWDFRCQWLGWHSYIPTWRLIWRDGNMIPAYWRYEEVCRNLNCRVAHLGTSRSYRWRPEMGDGPYPLGPDGKEIRWARAGQQQHEGEAQ